MEIIINSNVEMRLHHWFLPQSSREPGIPADDVVRVTLRLTEFLNLMGDPIYAHPLEHRTFSYPLHAFLNPHSLRQTVCEILSHLSCLDSSSLQFWTEQVSAFCSCAALAAQQSPTRSRGLQLLVDVHLDSGHPSADEEDLFDDWDADEEYGAEERGGGASGSAINMLQLLRFDVGGDGFREKDCSICLEDFEVGMDVTRLPCSHDFHHHCVVQWLEKSRFCPLCRYKMPAA